MSGIYLDHSATTPLAPEVFESMRPFLLNHFGNASSIHAFGREAKVAIDAAREIVASSLGATPAEIVFTSGGTEANNLAILGFAQAFENPCHIITSRIEHPCVLRACQALEQRGWQVTYVRPDDWGRIAAGEVARALRPDTVLISIMHANNEVGTINPIAEIAELAASQGIAFHTDAVQTYGKIKIDVRATPVSLLSLSGHKIYGPKGVGALYVKAGTRIEPILRGGKQEGNRRAGTENVAAIAGLGKAVQLREAKRASEWERLRRLSEDLLHRLRSCYPRAVLNSHPEARLAGVLNISFPGFDSLSLVMALDLHAIAVSNGSACSSGSVEPSYVLRAMKVGNERANSALRLSLGESTTESEIDTTANALDQILNRRRHIRQTVQQEAPA